MSSRIVIPEGTPNIPPGYIIAADGTLKKLGDARPEYILENDNGARVNNPYNLHNISHFMKRLSFELTVAMSTPT
jgi:hypothetical protein